MSLPGSVEAHAFGAGGQDAGPLTAQEVQLALRADQLLRADPHWPALNSPTLVRVEANRALSVDTPGFLYLRYSVQGGAPQEFWAHTAPHDHVGWKGGQVAVKGGTPS